MITNKIPLDKWLIWHIYLNSSLVFPIYVATHGPNIIVIAGQSRPLLE